MINLIILKREIYYEKLKTAYKAANRMRDKLEKDKPFYKKDVKDFKDAYTLVSVMNSQKSTYKEWADSYFEVYNYLVKQGL